MTSEQVAEALDLAVQLGEEKRVLTETVRELMRRVANADDEIGRLKTANEDLQWKVTCADAASVEADRRREQALRMEETAVREVAALTEAIGEKKVRAILRAAYGAEPMRESE